MGILNGSAGESRKKAEEEVATLLETARAAYAARQMRGALDALHAAHAIAAANGMHREAAELKRGVAILGNRGKPKILGRTGGPGKKRE